ncbi:MAG: homoserine dehydrogenase [Leptolinea sp.]|jgi:homoserine dehydrogenase|nr:homoserine dehydrogenase [Leptolinea sp.]
MSTLSIIFVGFGNVGQALARLLERKRKMLDEQFNFDYRIVGIATGRHGMAFNPDGLPMENVIAALKTGGSLDSFHTGEKLRDTFDFIRSSEADILFENSPVNHKTGQPAIDHLRAGLEAGMHVITANKGPVVHAYKELTELAEKQGKRFLFESAVMDGAPIFSLFRGPLPAIELKGFTGILNSCTNLLIGLMEDEKTFDEAVSYAQSIGIAETDPSADIDGWDAAIKVCALSTVVMGVPITPDQVDRQGIREITPAMIQEARAAGERWKLVCSAHRVKDGIKASVRPERVRPTSPLFSINGTSSFVQFETDVLPGLGIVEGDPSPDTTAYGLLADLINAVRGR